MRNWIRKYVSLLLVMALLLPLGAAATETEGTEIPETLPEETVGALPAPEETQPEETVPEETEPEETFPEYVEYTVDEDSDMYRALDALVPELVSDQILVYDYTNDKILYTMTTEGDKLYPASITKLFSTYVALQYLDDGEIITAGEELKLVKPGSSMAYIGKGHRLYVRTVVEAMMLPSGNDAAMVLAAAAGRRIAGDETLEPEKAVQAFVAEMNRQAKGMGFEKTHFSNPDGFHSGSHYTSLKDMARIAKLALGNKVISRYMKLYQDEVVFVSGQAITWKNTNLFLSPEDGYFRGDAIGMKTGFTRQAEYCLMSAFRAQGGRTIVIGAFGCDDEFARFRDINKIINACNKQIKQEAQQ